LVLPRMVHTSLRKLAQTTDRKEGVDRYRWAVGIILPELKIVSHVGHPGFIQKTRTDDPGIAERVILAKDFLACRPFRTKLVIVDKVGLVPLIDVIPVHQVIPIRKLVIDPDRIREKVIGLW